MTDDQAATLRMVMSGMKEPEKEKPESEATVWTIPHKVVVVAGGKRGAGCSTITANLVAEAAHRGIRAIRVGAEILRAALPEKKPDYYLLDAGAGVDFEGIADFLVLVATPERDAITGAYVALKRFRKSDPELSTGIVMNRVRTPGEGAALGERIASAATSLLGGPRVEVLGWVLEDLEVARARCDRGPVVVTSPRSAAATGIRLCARTLWGHWRPRWSAAAA